MNKQILNSMKKFIFSLIFVIMFGLSFTSCSHDFETYTPEQVVQMQYDNAFRKTFGNPAETQDWGFGNYVLPVAQSRAITRAANVNGNEWGTSNGAGYLDYPHPEAITEQELADVLEVFNQKGEEKYEPLVDFRNFFVQQVYTGTAHYTAKNGEDVLGSNKMHELHCWSEYNQTNWWPIEFSKTEGHWDYINNTNNANITAWEGCTLMLMSSTLKWKYKSSQDGGNFFEYWRMEKINGNYYVGFDFSAEGNNPNQQVTRDLIYNDWIIKIVPGKGESIPEPNRYKVRIIAEDLCATQGSDFDFNDVVFDAAYKDGEDKTYITIQAAGGTLPLFVEGQEVHDLFAQANPNKNITRKTMINTNNGTLSLDPVSFVIDRIIAPWDIKVAVVQNDNLIELKAETGHPAAKIAVDPDFVWCDEYEDIRTRYPNFSKYVQDTTVEWY